MTAMKKFGKHIRITALIVIGAVILFLGIKYSLKFKNNTQDYHINEDGIQIDQETTVAEKPEIVENIDELKILAFGDLMLDRNVFLLTKQAQTYEHPFLKIDSFLKEADLRVANLEGPITNFKSVANGPSRMRFTISPDFLPILKERFEIFSLANNHTLDFGESGLSQTRNYLKEAGIEYFGDYKNRKEYLSVVIEKNNIKVGFIGYHGLISSDVSEITTAIKELRARSDFLIIISHWGNEYQLKPSVRQQETAKEFIDAGADLILGSHPHVIQPVKIYNGKAIFYSLGNFVFDQYFSQETMQGLSVGINLQKKYNKDSGLQQIEASYRLYPLEISRQSQPELAGEKIARDILSKMSKSSEASEGVKEQLQRGYIAVLSE